MLSAVQKENKEFLKQLYQEYVMVKYGNAHDRVASKYDAEEYYNIDYDVLAREVYEEHNSRKITEYKDTNNNVDDWEYFSESMMKHKSLSNFVDNFMKRDNIYAKLIRLSEELAEENIYFMHNTFSGGASFRFNCESVFDKFEDCQGAVGWYTQDMLYDANSVHLLCNPRESIDEDNGNYDKDFILTKVYPTAKKLGLYSNDPNDKWITLHG